MSGYSYSTCRECRNATVAVANDFGLPSHARTRHCLCYSLLLVSRACLHLQLLTCYFCFFEPTVSQALSTREQKNLFRIASDGKLEGAWERGSELGTFLSVYNVD